MLTIVAVICSALAFDDDPAPGPVPESVRSAAADRWRQQYQDIRDNLDRLIVRLEAERTPAPLAKARAERAALQKLPFDHPQYGRLNGGVKVGIAGQFPAPAKFVKRDGDTWVVEVRHTYTRYGSSGPAPDTMTVRLAAVPDAVKPRVGATVKLPGWWVVTDREEVAARVTLTAAPLVVKPFELPEELRPKKKSGDR